MKRIAKAVEKLRAKADLELHNRGAMSHGAQVTVDYFALLDLIRYFEETRQAARVMIQIRDLTDGVMFSFNDNETSPSGSAHTEPGES